MVKITARVSNMRQYVSYVPICSRSSQKLPTLLGCVFYARHEHFDLKCLNLYAISHVSCAPTSHHSPFYLENIIYILHQGCMVA